MSMREKPALRPPWSPDQPSSTAAGRFGLFGPPRLAIHRIATPRWSGPDLRIAVLADPHVCQPWMTPERLAQIVAQIQETAPDLILVAGDYLPDRKLPCRHLPAEEIIPLLRPLTAPLGVWSVLGNHDWMDCALSRRSEFRENSVRDAFKAALLPLLSNEATPLSHGGFEFWLAGIDSQLARGRGHAGHDDAAAAFAAVPAGAPAILLAHEPDYFAKGDDRAFLQISGHTHGGQFVLFGRRPMTPSDYGDRYAIGTIVEGDRHLVVSAGLGYSGLPFRFGVPPEITLVDLRPA